MKNITIFKIVYFVALLMLSIGLGLEIDENPGSLRPAALGILVGYLISQLLMYRDGFQRPS
jgi:hypothetical protein